MVYGVGIDILNTERIASTLSCEDPFFTKTFTDNERAAAPTNEAARMKYFAAAFSLKEAVFKALKAGADTVRFNEIETRRDTFGVPSVSLHGNLLAYARRAGIRHIEVSVSYETACVVAFAIALRNNAE
jgi:holo-[acyl-carrier protein] synthase